MCFIVFLKSFVSCQALAKVLQQNSSLTNLNLASNNIGLEGTKAWCFGEDGVMRGEGVKKGKGRVKAQLSDNEVMEMTKGNAVRY